MFAFSTPSGFAKAPMRPGKDDPHFERPDIPTGKFISGVISNDWINDKYKLIDVDAPARALTVEAGGSRMWFTVSIKQMYGGNAKQAGLVASQCHAGAYANHWVVVVDDDIDPANVSDVKWEDFLPPGA